MLIVSDTRYGREKAKRAAQAAADKVGHKVYLQLDRAGGDEAGKLLVLIGKDGRGPVYLGMPWWEIYPTRPISRVCRAAAAGYVEHAVCAGCTCSCHNIDTNTNTDTYQEEN